jgi:hypothetical protein
MWFDALGPDGPVDERPCRSSPTEVRTPTAAEWVDDHDRGVAGQPSSPNVTLGDRIGQ